MPPQVQKISRFQKFKSQDIGREQIQNAPYNPRYIDTAARNKLKEKIKKVGLVETLVWNKQTGNLVSGHQRLSILDELERNKNYKLTVAVINLDLKQEKELNIFMNNTSSQGVYDLDLLENLLKECDEENLGFDKLDLQMLFSDSDNAGIFDENKESEQVKSDINIIKDMKKASKVHKDKQQKIDDKDYYMVLVFQSKKECTDFMRGMKLPIDNRYVDGRKFAKLVGVELHKN